MLISVVIPTCNRNDLLSLCLQSLAPGKQTLSIDYYEVIVTDDGKKNSTSTFLKENYPWVKYVKGPERGPAANRNNGAKHAIGEWLVFTDDDCLPSENWLSVYLSAIKQYPDVKAFEGAIFPTDVKELETNDMVACPVNTTGGNFWSANIMVTKNLFSDVKGFDEDYFLAAQEDQQFKIDIQKKEQIHFLKDCIVLHPIKHLNFAKEITSVGIKAKNYALFVLKNNDIQGPGAKFSLYMKEVTFHFRRFLSQLVRFKWRSGVVSFVWMIYGALLIFYYTFMLRVERK